MNYAHRIRAGGAQPELFFHGEVLNVFKRFPAVRLRRHDVQQRRRDRPDDHRSGGPHVAHRRSGLQAFNPFTTAPVRGTHWDFGTTPGSEFGTALSQFAYTTPRLFRFSVGIRF